MSLPSRGRCFSVRPSSDFYHSPEVFHWLSTVLSTFPRVLLLRWMRRSFEVQGECPLPHWTHSPSATSWPSSPVWPSPSASSCSPDVPPPVLSTWRCPSMSWCSPAVCLSLLTVSPFRYSPFLWSARSCLALAPVCAFGWSARWECCTP